MILYDLPPSNIAKSVPMIPHEPTKAQIIVFKVIKVKIPTKKITSKRPYYGKNVIVLTIGP